MPEVDRYAPAPILVVPVLRAASAEVGGVDQARSCGVQLADEDISVPAISGLEGARRRGEIEGARVACHVGVARGVDGDALTNKGNAAVAATSAQVGGIDQGGAGSIQLGYERVPVPAVCGLEGAQGGGEIRRKGVAVI